MLLPTIILYSIFENIKYLPTHLIPRYKLIITYKFTFYNVTHNFVYQILIHDNILKLLLMLVTANQVN